MEELHSSLLIICLDRQIDLSEEKGELKRGIFNVCSY